MTAIIIIAPSLLGGVKLQVRNGLPIVDGVFVNAHGPYRFLIDTGSNVNLIDARIGREIGTNATFEADLASATGKTHISGSDENQVDLGPVDADRQKFVYSGLEGIRRTLPDIQGVLGEWFLSRIDFTLDLRHGLLQFGKQDRPGQRYLYKIVNARPVISTSLGRLALDSGTSQLTLFGVQANSPERPNGILRTLTGTNQVGILPGEVLVIDGRRIWSGNAIAIPTRPEKDVDGLLPLSLFMAVYFCNSEGYVIFE